VSQVGDRCGWPPGEIKVLSLGTGAVGVREVDTWSENFSWLNLDLGSRSAPSLSAVEGDQGSDVAESVAHGP